LFTADGVGQKASKKGNGSKTTRAQTQKKTTGNTRGGAAKIWSTTRGVSTEDGGRGTRFRRKIRRLFRGGVEPRWFQLR